MVAGPKDSVNLAEEAVLISIETRGFDVDHDVRALVRQRKVLRITLHEAEARHPVNPAANRDQVRRKVDARDTLGAQ